MTTLSQQLRRLAAQQGPDPFRDPSGASLLFDASDAQRYGMDEFYALGVNGFSTLLTFDPSLSDFTDSLFSESSRDIQRGLLSKAQEDEVNSKIDEFLYRCMPFVQLTAGQKAIEWLIQRFEIASKNPVTLLGTFFPYHGTNIFRRLVQHVVGGASQLKDWEWLKEVAKNNVPITRDVLVSYCLRERTGFATVRNVVTRAFSIVPPEHHESLKLLCTFNTNIVLALVFVDRVHPSWFVNDVLAHAVEGIRSPYLPLAQSALSILAGLATKAPLDPRLTSPLLVEVVKHGLNSEQLLEQCFMTAAVLCLHTEEVGVTKKCMKRLLRSPSFPAFCDILLRLAREYDVCKLIEVLSSGLALVESRKDQLERYCECDEFLKSLKRNPDIVVEMETS